MSDSAFQDLMHDNFCFGCGAANADGLQIKSYWQGDGAICHYQPLPHHAAGPRHFLNGGIIATLIDCHAVCTAMADAYRRDGREVGEEPNLWYATTALRVAYLRPTPLAGPVEIWAEVLTADDRRTRLACRLLADGKVRVEGEVEAARVPNDWRHGKK